MLGEQWHLNFFQNEIRLWHCLEIELDENSLHTRQRAGSDLFQTRYWKTPRWCVCTLSSIHSWRRKSGSQGSCESGCYLWLSAGAAWLWALASQVPCRFLAPPHPTITHRYSCQERRSDWKIMPFIHSSTRSLLDSMTGRTREQENWDERMYLICLVMAIFTLVSECGGTVYYDLCWYLRALFTVKSI